MLTQSNPSCPTLAASSQPGLRVCKRVARRASDSKGLSLVEVLVVVLIIGVLAAIAIPSLLSSTIQAKDAQAKVLVRTAETAAEAIGTEQGNYSSVTPAGLAAEESAIPTKASNAHAYVSKTTPGENEYSITAKAIDGDELTIVRSASGTITRTCHSPILKTGCDGGENSSW